MRSSKKTQALTKSALIAELIDEYQEIDARAVDKATRAVMDCMAEALVRGERVEVRGFGSFCTRQRKARQGRNPRTGESVRVDAKSAVHFKAGKDLREKLND